MKIIFMGTPDFAVPALEKLAASGHEVCLAVTQPDRKKGRGQNVVFSPVKQCALAHGIPVFQPVKVKEESAVERLREEHADIIVVSAFGQILSKEILEMPRYGCINIHGSLLPKLRGAAPIQRAILDGEEETGITIMQMNEGLDTGDILMQRKTPIGPQETAGDLYERLSRMGADMILDALSGIENGTLKAVPQDSSGSTYAKMLKKEMGEISWEKSAAELDRLVRGLNPWPSAYTHYDGKMLKIWKAEPARGKEDAAPGTVTEVEKDWFEVKCKEGSLRVFEVQLQGKKRMSVHDFLLGYKVRTGERLG